LPWEFRTRDTVAMDTPAAAATARTVGFVTGPCFTIAPYPSAQVIDSRRFQNVSCRWTVSEGET
jgi:hypothetical protein